MKLQILHLSDMHFSKREDSFSINVDKMVQALESVETADERIIVISGDLTSTGCYKEYEHVNSFVGALLKELRKTVSEYKKIEIICVPGNHDVFVSKLDRNMDDKDESMDDINSQVEKYLSCMKGFFRFAQRRKCFFDDGIVSKRVFTYGNRKVGFVLLNTAPFSKLGGKAIDMGKHFLSKEQIDIIENATDADINILVMHHSMEWFDNTCKDRLRKIISKKYSLVLSGHEHEPVGESRDINNMGEVHCIQGNALLGYATEGNGFCTVNIDLDSSKMNAYSFLWKESLYVPHKIIEASVRDYLGGEFTVKKDFMKEISLDSNKRDISKYFVFPSLSYTLYKDNNEIEYHDIESENDFMDILAEYNKIIISGEHKSGKTLLAKRLFRNFIKQGKTPVLLVASDINKRKIEKTVEYAFCEQYDCETETYEQFRQGDIANKVVLLDEANLIQESTLKLLLDSLKHDFEKIILFNEYDFDLNIKRQITDILTDSGTLDIRLNPFLYAKRKELIGNILSCDGNAEDDLEFETNKINELINKQVKYFSLNPEFIINFVDQYERDYRFQFPSGMNIFSIVYESSIKNRIIENSENIDAMTVIALLRDLSFYMHFNKKSYIGIDGVAKIIEQYNNTYRQKANTRVFLDVAVRAKILVDKGNEVRFRDHTLVAYFVAQAINHKYYQEEDISFYIDCLLKNLCFSINSDIILFLALITDNPKFVNVIVESAQNHFSQQEELSFDKGNVNFLSDIAIPVKNCLPNDEERKERDKILSKEEKKVKLEDLIELVDEYDYSDDDLMKIENQCIISLKYIEVLSKSLPTFCQSMKAEQQDKLVALIYKCPNQFLYGLLKEISDNFDEFCNDILKDILEARDEKNKSEVSVDSIKRLIKQISAVLVVALYQVVASTCTSEQTLTALNSFNYEWNANYKLQNLMMLSCISDTSTFSKRAQSLNRQLDKKIEKSIIKHTVRDYLLRNNPPLYGDAQSLVDCFFSGNEKTKLKTKMVKKRVIEKDNDGKC